MATWLHHNLGHTPKLKMHICNSLIVLTPKPIGLAAAVVVLVPPNPENAMGAADEVVAEAAVGAVNEPNEVPLPAVAGWFVVLGVNVVAPTPPSEKPVQKCLLPQKYSGSNITRNTYHTKS